MGNNHPKGQIGREVQETDVLFNLDIPDRSRSCGVSGGRSDFFGTSERLRLIQESVVVSPRRSRGKASSSATWNLESGCQSW